MQLIVCYQENRHHQFKKYHSYPLSQTLYTAWSTLTSFLPTRDDKINNEKFKNYWAQEDLAKILLFQYITVMLIHY